MSVSSPGPRTGGAVLARPNGASRMKSLSPPSEPCAWERTAGSVKVCKLLSPTCRSGGASESQFNNRLEYCTSFLAAKDSSPVRCRSDIPLDGKMKRFSGQNQQYPDPSQPPDQGENSFNTGGSKKCKTTQSFESLFDSESLSDITISINDGLQTFHGHKMIIGLKSPILATLMDDVATTSGEATPCLYLTETEECIQVFHRFLYFIYSGAVWLHRDYVLPLQKLARKYDVMPLVQHCENYILQILNSCSCNDGSEERREFRGFPVEVICDLHESNDIGEHVKNIAFMVLCTRAKEIIHSPRWRTCGYDLVCELLKNDETQAVENALLTAATNWMKANNLQEKSKIEGILTNIRYPLLHRRVLYHLQKNNAFKNFPPVQELVSAAIRYHCFKDLSEAKNDFTGIQYTPRVSLTSGGHLDRSEVRADSVASPYENSVPSPTFSSPTATNTSSRSRDNSQHNSLTNSPHNSLNNSAVIE